MLYWGVFSGWTCSKSLAPKLRSHLQVISQILGEQALPWETKEEGKGLLKSAGRSQKPIFGLLQQDPDQRLTVNEFMQNYLCCSPETCSKVS